MFKRNSLAYNKDYTVTMNPAHYVSLEIAKQLAEAGILFPASGYIFRYAWTDEWVLELRSISEMEGVELKKPSLPAPSFDEIMDRISIADTADSRVELIKYYDKYVCLDIPCGQLINIETEAPTAPDAAGLMLIKREGEK